MNTTDKAEPFPMSVWGGGEPESDKQTNKKKLHQLQRDREKTKKNSTGNENL